MDKVLAFGSFDGIHKGHRYFLSQAKALGSYLVVAVAPDGVITKIKSRPPSQPQAQRIQALKNERLADSVILADAETGSWQIIKQVKPSVIAIGHDQAQLKQSLEDYLTKAYPIQETEEGFQENSKRPKIVVLNYFK